MGLHTLTGIARFDPEERLLLRRCGVVATPLSAVSISQRFSVPLGCYTSARGKWTRNFCGFVRKNAHSAPVLLAAFPVGAAGALRDYHEAMKNGVGFT